MTRDAIIYDSKNENLYLINYVYNIQKNLEKDLKWKI